MKKIIFIFFVLITSLNLSAAAYDYLYRDSRPLGMGGAFTAVSNDVNGLFYNPAGLNRIEKGQGKFTFFNPMLTTNMAAINMARNISDVVKGADLLDSLTSDLGANNHIGVQMMPHWVRKNFGVGLLLPNIKTDVMLRRNVLTQGITNITVDAGAVVGYAHGFMQDRLSIGTDVKVLARGAGSKVFDAEELYRNQGIDFEDIVGYGIGVDMDLGALYTFNKIWFFVPTVGLSLNNLIGTNYGRQIGSSSIGAVPAQYALQRHANLGSKFELPDFWHLKKWIVAVDINHIGLAGSFFKKFHIGTEMWLMDFFGFRTGLNQGYLTAGITFDVPFCQVDIFTYGEELGDTVGTRGDRRFGIQLSVGL